MIGITSNLPLIETVAEAYESVLEEWLEQAIEARLKVVSACLAMRDYLNTPYDDAPQWTPWTRFVEPALKELDVALGIS